VNFVPTRSYLENEVISRDLSASFRSDLKDACSHLVLGPYVQSVEL
jgi:hypothetical protein